ncbi:hypothetical protein [Haloferax volcanii]|uniref:Uncharacterized protein n=1 Tax=Haloferax volcanii TaxID=2246 RepID=A0A847TPN1_HALVO|nr:hypothetical protein [Haloferax alexandrinus]NLV03005.1 hypothetical protein [Haloferax alexandrinus]
MPVFHKYSDSYHKSGYYVKVNWSAPHPYPLQTPALTEQIYLELGFGDGDQVPNELTSRLFNAGLHWTEGNGTGDPQKQTGLNSITDADIPNLSTDQLNRVYDTLDRVETSSELGEINSDALQDLKSELETLETSSNDHRDGRKQRPTSISDETLAILSDLKDEDISVSQARELRQSAKFPNEFDKSVREFTRKHPITPHDFSINNHGDPTYEFQTGPVKWTLADCRAKSLTFDWAVTIFSKKDGQFGLRLSSNRLVRVVSDGKKLTRQQATNLTTILPCLLWTLDLLKEYHLSMNFTVGNITSSLPSPQKEWLKDQLTATRSALKSDSIPGEGVIVDHPDRYFARIRTTTRAIVWASVNSLPESTTRGEEVSFQVQERNGKYFAKGISPIESSECVESSTVLLSKKGGFNIFELPGSCDDEVDKVDTLISILQKVSVVEALSNESVWKLLLNTQVNDEGKQQEILSHLLKATPFSPEEFPKIVDGLSNHHRIPISDVSFDIFTLASCMACFYDELDMKETVERMDKQGDTTVLYHRDGDYLIVGDELINHGVGGALDAIPNFIEESMNEFDLVSPVIRVLSGLCEQQFCLDRRGAEGLTSMVIQSGLREEGLNTLYVRLD